MSHYADYGLQRLSGVMIAAVRHNSEAVKFHFKKHSSSLGKSAGYSQLSSCIVQVCTSIGKFFKSIGHDKVNVSLNMGKKGNYC